MRSHASRGFSLFLLRPARLAVLAVVASLLIATAAVADDLTDLQNQQQTVKDAITQTQNDIDDASADAVAATKRYNDAIASLNKTNAQLDTTKSELADAQTVLDQVQARLDIAQQQLAVAQTDLTAGQQQADAQKSKLRAQVISTFTAGDPSLQQVGQIINATSPSDIVMQQQYRQVRSGVAARTYADVKASEILLDVHAREAKRIQDQIAADEALQQQKVDEVAAKKKQLEQLQATLVDISKEAQDAQADAKRIFDEDTQKLQYLQQQQWAIEQQLAKYNQSRTVLDTGGMFGRPLAGGYVITAPFGWRTNPITHSSEMHPGIDLGVSCGTQVHAAETGQVEYVGYNGGYGNRVVIDHGLINGQRYYTTYNHLSAFQVSVGQVVARGQVVALSGTTGMSTGCHLHFEVAIGTTSNVQQPLNYVVL